MNKAIGQLKKLGMTKQEKDVIRDSILGKPVSQDSQPKRVVVEKKPMIRPFQNMPGRGML